MDRIEQIAQYTKDYIDAKIDSLSSSGGGSGESTDVRINNQSIVVDNVANIPVASGSKLGVISPSASIFDVNQSTGIMTFQEEYEPITVEELQEIFNQFDGSLLPFTLTNRVPTAPETFVSIPGTTLANCLINMTIDVSGLTTSSSNRTIFNITPNPMNNNSGNNSLELRYSTADHGFWFNVVCENITYTLWANSSKHTFDDTNVFNVIIGADTLMINGYSFMDAVGWQWVNTVSKYISQDSTEYHFTNHLSANPLYGVKYTIKVTDTSAMALSLDDY